MVDSCFADIAKDIKDPIEVLNWYRILYYKDAPDTERGLVASAINDILPEYTRQKAEIERLKNMKERLKKENG